MNHNSHIWSHCLQPRHFTHWVYSDVVHSIFPFIGHAGVPGFGALFPDENGNFDEMWSCSSCCSHNGSRNPRQCWNLNDRVFKVKKGQSRSQCLYFRLFNTVDSKHRFNKCLPMTGFEQRSLVSEVTALPTEPQPLPKNDRVYVQMIWVLLAVKETVFNWKRVLVEVK